MCFLGWGGLKLRAHSSLGQPSLYPALLLSTIQLCSIQGPASQARMHLQPFWGSPRPPLPSHPGSIYQGERDPGQHQYTTE